MANDDINDPELRLAIKRMDAALDHFSVKRKATGDGRFRAIEGIMLEYINLCRRAAERGIDFRGGPPLEDFEGHSVVYIYEKLIKLFGERMIRAIAAKLPAKEERIDAGAA
jgi:hypothetical protein